jgi:uncharacterized glyoxalase superfamily protein PhnB
MEEENIHEEKEGFTLEIDMEDNRLDISYEAGSIMMVANVDFWASLYAQLKDIFEDLDNAEEDGRGSQEGSS